MANITIDWYGRKTNFDGIFSGKNSDQYFSLPIDTINSALSSLPSNCKITNIHIYGSINIECSAAGQWRWRIGYGGSGSIGTELNRVDTSGRMDWSTTANANLNAIINGNRLNKNYGDYITFNICSPTNPPCWGKKSYWVGKKNNSDTTNSVYVDVTYITYHTLQVTSNMSNRGTVSGSGTYDYGTTVTVTATPNTGYKISYWQKDGQTISGSEGKTSLSISITGTTVVMAVFDPISYTISFDGNGATSGSTASINTQYNKTEYLPGCGFARTGYTFTSWYNSSIGQKQPGDSVSNLLSVSGTCFIYAEWKANEFLLRYNPNGGTGTPQLSTYNYQTDSVNIMVERISFTKKGYVLTGWNTKQDGSGLSIPLVESGLYPNPFVPEQDNIIIELYAQWQPISYTIEFDSNDGIGTMSNLAMVYDVPQTLPKNTFTKAGHTFIGWSFQKYYYEDGFFQDMETVINLTEYQDYTVTLYALWEINKYTITWKDWDGTELEKKQWNYNSIPKYSGNEDSLNYESDDAFYDFDGWTPQISEVTQDVTYTATYLRTPKTYTVRWVDWDGSELEVDTNVLYGDIPVFNYTKTPHRESDDPKYYYVFNNNWDTTIAPVTGNITYTAVYTKNINKYTVIWLDWNGDELEKDVDVEYDTPPSYDRENPIRESTKEYDYVFIGWKTIISDDYVNEDELDVVRADITYIAVYEQKDRMYSFKINILPSEECGTVIGYTDSEYKYGAELNLTAIPSDDYQFVSWYYVVDGTVQTPKSDRLDISIFTDTEITAIFEEKPSMQIYINETQIDSIYVNPNTLTITYIIPNIIDSTIEDTFETINGWHFNVATEIPNNSFKVETIYVNDIPIN